MNSMGMIGLGIVLTLKDQASRGLDLLRQKMAGFSNVTQNMVRDFDKATTQILGGISSIIAGFKGFNVLESMFMPSINVSMGIEAAFARVKALVNGTEEQIKALKKQSEELGETTRFTDIDVLNAQANLAIGGFSTDQIKAAVPTVLKLALGAQVPLERAAEILAQSINQLRASADESEEIGNMLMETTKSSGTDLYNLSEALKYAAPTGISSGMERAEIMAWLGVAANAGLTGSIGGTGLTQVLTRFLDADTIKNAAKNFGIDIAASMSKDEIMTRINNALEGMDATSKTAALFDIFGKIGFKSASAMSGGVEGGLNSSYNQLFNKIKNSNALKEMAAVMDDTTEGAVFRLESATMSLQRVIGDNLKNTFRGLIETLAKVKLSLSKFIEAHPVLSKAIIGTVASLTAFASAALIAIGTLMTIGGAVKLWRNLKPVISDIFSALIPKANSVKAAFAGMSIPILELIALAGVLYYAYQENLFGIRDMFEAIGTGFSMAMNADKDGIVEIEDAALKRLEDAGLWEGSLNMGAMFFRFKAFFKGFSDEVTKEITTIKDAFADAFTWIDKQFTSFFGEDNFFSDLLKKISPDSPVESWENWGKIIGGIITKFVGLIIAIKAASIVMGGLSTAIAVATSPMFLMLGAIVLLIKYWDEFKSAVEEFWGFFGIGPAAEARDQQYTAAVSTSEDAIRQYYKENGFGYLFDENGNISSHASPEERKFLEAELANARANAAINESAQIQEKINKAGMFVPSKFGNNQIMQAPAIQAPVAAPVVITENNDNDDTAALLKRTGYDLETLSARQLLDIAASLGQGKTPSSQYIIQHGETQAGLNGEAAYFAAQQAQNGAIPEIKFISQITGIPFTINFDSEPITSKVLELIEVKREKQGGGDLD